MTQVYKRNLKPRQLDFIKYYTSPKSDTYSNAVQSAIAAGYSATYSHSFAHSKLVPLVEERLKQKEKRLITQAEKREKMLAKAEENLNEDLNIEHNNDKDLRKLRNSTSVFISETIGKDVYSRKQTVENVGKAVIPENTLNALENAFSSLTAAKHEATRAEYTVIDGETVQNDEEGDENRQ